jgi:hypothetical protein
VLLAIGASLAASCTCGKAAPATAPGACVLDAAAPTIGPGNVAGILYVDASGTITASRAKTPPAGSQAVAGATVSASEGPSTTTDGSGHFELDGVAPGAQLLTVTPSSGSPATIAVHSIPGVLATLGDPATSLADATQMVAQYAASLGAAGTTQTYATHEPLPAGVTIGTAMPLGALAAGESCVGSESWLFEVDPYPEFLSEHAVRFVLVDAQSGAITVRLANAWPTVNGAPLFHESDQNLATLDVVAAATAPEDTAPSSADLVEPDGGTTGQGFHADGHPFAGPPGGRKFGIIIRGDSSWTTGSALGSSARAFASFLASQGVMPGDLTQILPGSGDVLAQIKTALNVIALAATPCDTVYLAVFAHGYTVGDPAFNVDETYVDSTTGKSETTEVLISKNTLDLSRINAGHFNLFFETCGSGGWTNVVKSQLTAPGADAVVVTSADQDHSAAVNVVPIAGGAFGARFTNYFLAAAASQPSPVDFAQAYQDAMMNLQQDSTVSILAGTKLRAQSSLDAKPQLWVKGPQPGAAPSCDDAGVDAAPDAGGDADSGGSCTPEGTTCTADTDCTCGLVCQGKLPPNAPAGCTGSCAACHHSPGSCTTNADCCTADQNAPTCNGGVCCSPRGSFSPCFTDTDCCGGVACVPNQGGTACGVPNSACCIPYGAMGCSVQTDCCGRGNGWGGIPPCINGQCCVLAGASCSAAAAAICCSGVCNNGSCM